jgi:type IV pilus assembly protein PilN
MIRINLLPYRAARKKENISIQVNIFFGSLIVAIGIIFLVNTYLSGRIDKLNNEIASTKQQVAKYEEINKEIAEIKNKLDVLERKIQVINSLERDRKAPVENLDSLYNLVVEKRMWYTQIEEKGDDVKVSGIAVDNQTVADYMTRLEKSDRYTNVRLSAIKQHKLQNQDLNLKQFDINFQKPKMPNDQTKAAKK